MKILYCYQYDMLNPDVQSGRPYQVYRALLELNHEVVPLTKLMPWWSYFFKFLQLAYRLFGKNYRYDREPLILASMGRRMSHAARRHQPDLIVSPSTIPLAALPRGQEAAVVTDAIFQFNVDRYPEFRDLSRRYLKQGKRTDDRAMEVATRVIVPTAAVKASIVLVHPHSSHKVHVVPWGGTHIPPSPLTAEDVLAVRGTGAILFVGRDPYRKGFDIFCDVAREIRKKGRKVSCNVLGLDRDQVPAEWLVDIADLMVFHGALSASKDAATILQIFIESSILLLPSRAENFGITLVEASHNLLPTFGFDVDGLAATFSNSKGLHFLPPGSSPHDFARRILPLIDDRSAYAAVVRSMSKDGSRPTWRDVAVALAPALPIAELP